MTGGTRFADLPEELFEIIAAQIELGDLCSLRLTTPEIALKASQGCFRSYFVNAILLVIQDRCQFFAAVTQRGGLSCTLENLTIIGSVDPPDDESFQAFGPESIEYLTKALRNVRANSPTGRLRSLVVTVQDARTRDRCQSPMYSKDQIQGCAMEIERMVSFAIEDSGLEIESLDMYGDIGRCAMSFSRFNSFRNVLGTSTSVMQSLTLVLTSDVVDEPTQRDYGISRHVSSFLAQLPQLERLDLRRYNSQCSNLTGADYVDRLFFTTIACLFIPRLNRLCLRGVYTTTTDLLGFLRRHTAIIKHLCLENVKLIDGRFDAIFTHISDRLELDSLYLCGLHGEVPGAIQFIGVRGEHLYGHSGPPTWVKREGEATRQRLPYKLVTGRTKGYYRNERYFREVRDRFG